MRSQTKSLDEDAHREGVPAGERTGGKEPRGRSQPVKEILFVCLGNVCRSPMAEVLASSLAAKRGLEVRFCSAGIEVNKRGPTTPEALQVMAELEHDLSAHTSRPLTAEMVHAADLLVAMEAWQVRALRARYPAAREKLFVLPEFSSNSARSSIHDPFGHDLDAYRVCRDAIRDCVTNLLSHLASGGCNPSTMATTRPARAASLSQLASLAVLIAAACLIFSPLLESLWHTWMREPNNSHGLLVPAVSAWLIWNRRRELGAGEPSLGGLVLLLAGLLMYAAGTVGFIRFLAAVGAVAALSGLAWFNLGTRSFRSVAFAFAFLLFAIPVPIAITSLVAFPLQLLASKVSAAIMGLAGIPVLREGNILFFTNTHLEVAEACSGIRSIMAFLMLGTLFAYLLKRRWSHRLVIIALAIPLAVAMNIVRVAGTGVLAHAYGDAAAKGFFHQFSGLAVFAAGFLVMAAMYLLLERRPSRAR